MNILDCFSKMHTSFKDLKVFAFLPKSIEDLIFVMAYGLTRQTLHLKANSTRTASYTMPVPIAWKRFINIHDGTFYWRLFLQDIYAELIDVESVKESLNLLNWNQLRSKQNAIANLVRTVTKTNMRYALSVPGRRSTTIHMIWHILTCATRGDYCTRAFRGNNVKDFLYVPYFNRPLTAYYPSEVAWTAWDQLVHGTSVHILYSS